MNRPYPDEPFDDCVDRATDEAVQEEVDNAAEAKRNAVQTSPEILSLQDAYIEGARAGGMGFGANLNPYQDGAPEHAEWERGRMSALGSYMKRVA